MMVEEFVLVEVVADVLKEAVISSPDERNGWDGVVRDMAWCVRNVAKGRAGVKKSFLEAGLAELLVKILNTPWTEAARFQTACALANILTTDWILPIPLEDAVPPLVALCITLPDPSLRILPVTALRNVLVCGFDPARAKVMSCKVFSPLREAFESNDEPLVEEATAAIRDLARLDTPSKAKTQISDLIPHILSLLYPPTDTSTPPPPPTKTHNLLAILTNLTTSTPHARKILANHETTLIPLLFTLLLQHPTPPILQTDTLATLANLCIDTPSNLLILQTGLPLLLKTLFTSAPSCRPDCMATLRNLILQTPFCFSEIITQEGFVTELVANVPSRRHLLQGYALEIVWEYLSKGDDSIKKLFWEAGCMSAVLVPMEERRITTNESVDDLRGGEGEDLYNVEWNKTIAGKCFRVLAEYEERVVGVKDPWMRVWGEWKEQDRVRKEERRMEREKRRVEGKESKGRRKSSAAGRGVGFSKEVASGSKRSSR
ncbi:hypothetical protein HK097_005814 [Rhizophlyctis rosea]|uniref:ARM repeat-containing protein n=1 Tax=Rhizophlyctis rosea TaxID=64517 RepID=A0AAD5X5Z5_9FUNG|nr:hypothetical protein HK097_005814 [Rhizophlyctis rosea]